MQKLSPIEVNEICTELGETYPKSIEPVHGGDIHSAWQIEFSTKKNFFLKRTPKLNYGIKSLKRFNFHDSNTIIPAGL